MNTIENPFGQIDGTKTRFWAGVGFRVREGMKMHQATGQLEKGPDSWRNVTEHCLVQVARAETLAGFIGLPNDLVGDMRIGAMLHDFNKRQEIIVTRQANENGTSPLAAVRSEHQRAEEMLRGAGFSELVIRFASAPGGDAPQLIEAQRILDQENLSDEDSAYLICHYVDDCSVGSDWVRPLSVDSEGRKSNIIDYRAEENKSKSTYKKISAEIGAELAGTPFEGMNNHDVMSQVSHGIEQVLAQRIKKNLGIDINPLSIPELVDNVIESGWLKPHR